MDVRFGAKVGQIGPKFGQIGDFSDQIPVNLDTAIQNVLKSDLKSPGFFLFGAKMSQFWAHIWPTSTRHEVATHVIWRGETNNDLSTPML